MVIHPWPSTGRRCTLSWELVLGLAMGQVAVKQMEYDGRVAGIGSSAGKEGDMGRSGLI
jgi:hypothetical protein